MIAKTINRHRYRILIGVIVLFVVYHVAKIPGAPVEIVESVNAGSNKPMNDPVDVEKISPSTPFDSTTNQIPPAGEMGALPVVDEEEAEKAIKGKVEGKEGEESIGDGVESESKKAEKGDKGAVEEGINGDKTKGKGSGKGSGTKEATAPKLSSKILKSIRDFTVFFNGIEDYAIKSPSIKDKYTTDKARELFSSTTGFLFSKEYLENVLDIPETTFEELKKSHQGYVDIHMKKLEQYGISTFGNILESDPEWNSYVGTKGYVMIGGGRYSWLSFLVIKQIRAIGSTLPIELFIPSSEEYEKKFCEELLHGYNARCNVFDDKLAAKLSLDFGLGGYQYKMLALMSSKFENIIYLDSDNFPVRNPEFILESDLFKEKGLIIWPDAWARTTNPKFYDIAGLEVKEKKVRTNKYDEEKGIGKDATFKDSWYHNFEGALPDPTSETGMMVINKTKHVKTLLLSLYYNLFGPDHYYPLMTQGSAGEGDKETFIAAASVLDEPWFQTLKQFKWCGYESEVDNKFTSKALGHYDPIQSQTDPDGDLDIIFMHLSYPKFYPNWLADNHDLIYEESGTHIRMYGGIYSNAGYDFDLRVLQFFTQGMCPNYYDDNGKSLFDDGLEMKDEYMGNYLTYVASDKEVEEARCKDIFIPHLNWLKETTEYPNSIVHPKPHGDFSEN